MSLDWLWLIIPPCYAAMWYLTARFFVRVQIIVDGTISDSDLNADIICAVLWPLTFWIFLVCYGAEPLQRHFRRTALPKSKRPLPDLRAVRETKQIKPR